MPAQLMVVRDYVIAAGETLRLQIPGSYFQLMESPSEVDIEFFSRHSSIGRATRIPEGFEFGPLREEFYEVHVTSVPGTTVKLCIARFTARLNRIAGAIDADITKATILDSLPDAAIAATTTAQVAAADAGRRAIMVSNLAGNTDEMRIGDAGAAATTGIPLQPGETVTLVTAAAVFAFNAAAAAQSVALTVIKD